MPPWSSEGSWCFWQVRSATRLRSALSSSGRRGHPTVHDSETLPKNLLSQGPSNGAKHDSFRHIARHFVVYNFVLYTTLGKPKALMKPNALVKRGIRSVKIGGEPPLFPAHSAPQDRPHAKPSWGPPEDRDFDEISTERILRM